MTVETFITPKKIEEFKPVADFVKIHEVSFRNSHGFLINCNVVCMDENAKFCEFGIKTSKGCNFGEQEFNFGPYDLTFGNVDLDLKNEVAIVRGNKLEFYARNNGLVPVTFVINTEIRYESY